MSHIGNVLAVVIVLFGIKICLRKEKAVFLAHIMHHASCIL